MQPKGQLLVKIICHTTCKLLIHLTTTAFLISGLANDPVLADGRHNEPPPRSSNDSDGCLQINRDFFNLSAETGGDFYFWGPGEFAASAAILRIPITSDPILLDYGTGDHFAKSYEIPVDTGVVLLSVFTGAQRKDLVVLYRPDGRSTSANPAFVSDQNYRHMNIITVDKPEPGMWRLEWKGAGHYAVTVKYSGRKGKTSSGQDEGIDLIDMKFVEPGGRPGHEGLFPVKGKVRSGQSRLCKLKITGKVSEPVAEFLSRDNRILGRVELQPVPESDGEFLATCTVPAVPFRTRVSGRDIDGYPFQRVTSALYTPAR